MGGCKLAYYLELDGELVSRRKYCRRKGLNYSTVKTRMYTHNETFEQAIHYYENNELRKPKGTSKDTRFYGIWREMVDRCTNLKNPSFEKYSKLGIQESWLEFENFQDDMYEEYLKCPRSPNDLPSIDRRNNNIGYFKENCRWIPRSKQNRNKNNNLWANEDELLIDYCERKGLRYNVILSRIKMGYTLEEAEAMPIPKYTGKYLEYVGKNIREFNILKLDDIYPKRIIAKCNICNAKITFHITNLLNRGHNNKGCSCRKGHKFYIGNNNYTYRELDTIYNYTHKQIKEAIANNDMSLFSDIVDLSYDEWIELLKDIHNRW